MGTTRPFRFGVQAINATSGTDWRETVGKAEDLGYSTLFLADHYLGKGPATREASQMPQGLAPIAAMASAAAMTTTLRVGCRVFCVDYHVPAVLAKEAATLDALSDGRLDFGIGAGWSSVEYRAMGLSFDAPGRRIAKLKEFVALFKAHCTGELLDVEGEFVTAAGYTGLPLPAQRPHPPVMIGGGGKKVLTLAAHEADIVSISNVPFDAVNDAGLTPQGEAQRRLGYVRDAAGDRMAEIDVESSPFFSEVTDDPQAAAQRVGTMLNIPTDGLVEHPNVLIGTVEELIDRLHERRETYAVNFVTVQRNQLEAFAPIVAALNGR